MGILSSFFEKRFKRDFINCLINELANKGFNGLEPISNLTVFYTEGTFYATGKKYNLGTPLKILIYGNKHQFNWEIGVDWDVNVGTVRVSKIVADKFLHGQIKTAGLWIKTETLKDFINVGSKMETQALLIKKELEDFFTKHEEEIKSFQERINKEVNEFSEKLVLPQTSLVAKPD